MGQAVRAKMVKDAAQAVNQDAGTFLVNIINQLVMVHINLDGAIGDFASYDTDEGIKTSGGLSK